MVDDDKDSRKSVTRFLVKLGHNVVEAENGQIALNKLVSADFPMVLSDIKMPEMDGIELLQSIARSSGEHRPSVVLFTGYGDMESAIAALRAGAYDYLTKPINVEELAIITERIAEYQYLVRENKVLNERFEDKLKAATEETQRELVRLREVVARSAGLKNIGFFSKNMRQIYKMTLKYHTDRSIPVLIEGDTGSGKEVIAKLVHYGNFHGSNFEKPFVAINCAALTPTLFESELFGYEGGAFTGSLAKGHQGKLDLAFGGTLFLDEVGEIPIELQGKLLRVIQEKEFYRVGGLKKIKTNVRIVCATNADLTTKVKNGSFRKDLYFRLKVGHLVIPPLSQRKAEILPLAKMFLKEFSKSKGKKFKYINEAATQVLLEYSWPGNVRELRNVMEWVVFMYDDVEVKPGYLDIIKSTGKINSQVVPDKSLNIEEIELPQKGFSLDEHVNNIVYQALKKYKGNKTKTAKYLGISRKSLYVRLQHLKEKDDL